MAGHINGARLRPAAIGPDGIARPRPCALVRTRSDYTQCRSACAKRQTRLFLRTLKNRSGRALRPFEEIMIFSPSAGEAVELRRPP